MKKILNYSLILIIAMCAVLCFVACDKSCVDEPVLGEMGNSYWTTYEMEKVAPFYTIRFTGKNECRFRDYVTTSVDIDHYARYEVSEDGTILIYEKGILLGTLKVIDDNTMEFTREGKSIFFYRK